MGRLTTCSDSRSETGTPSGPDGKWLYVVLSTLPGVARVALSEDGKVGKPEIAVKLTKNVPDGIAFDSHGNLYLAEAADKRLVKLVRRWPS